jgi:hypothetical protein
MASDAMIAGFSQVASITLVAIGNGAQFAEGS